MYFLQKHISIQLLYCHGLSSILELLEPFWALYVIIMRSVNQRDYTSNRETDSIFPWGQKVPLSTLLTFSTCFTLLHTITFAISLIYNFSNTFSSSQSLRFSVIWHSSGHPSLSTLSLKSMMATQNTKPKQSFPQRGSSKDRVLINVIQEWLKSYAG